MHTNGRNHHHNRGEPLLQLPHVPVIVRPPHPARTAMKRWPSLGAAVHYRTHLALHLQDDPAFPLPEISSISFFTPSGHQTAGPSDRLVAAIDRRAGRHDDQLQRSDVRQEEMFRLNEALERLREFDEVLFRIAQLVCVEGRVVLLPGHGLRHVGDNFETAAARYFEDDVRRLQEWLGRAWQFLGILLAPSDTLAQALAAGAVWRKAYQWLMDIPFE